MIPQKQRQVTPQVPDFHSTSDPDALPYKNPSQIKFKAILKKRTSSEAFLLDEASSNDVVSERELMMGQDSNRVKRHTKDA